MTSSHQDEGGEQKCLECRGVGKVACPRCGTTGVEPKGHLPQRDITHVTIYWYEQATTLRTQLAEEKRNYESYRLSHDVDCVEELTALRTEVEKLRGKAELADDIFADNECRIWHDWGQAKVECMFCDWWNSDPDAAPAHDADCPKARYDALTNSGGGG